MHKTAWVQISWSFGKNAELPATLDLYHQCCCCLVIKLCLTLCDPMDCSTPGFPILHYLWVCSNSCPLSGWCYLTISSSAAPSPFAFNLSPHQNLFQWVSSSHPSGGQSTGASASASVLPMNIQDCFPLGWTGWISLQSEGLWRVFSNTTVRKY